MALVTLTSAVAGQVATAVFYNNNNNALLNQVNGNLDATNLADLAVTTPKIAAAAVTGPKIAMGSDAQGDILYFNGTQYARLGAGTAGYVLRTGGAGANPSWVENKKPGFADWANKGSAVTLDAATLAAADGWLVGTIDYASTATKYVQVSSGSDIDGTELIKFSFAVAASATTASASSPICIPIRAGTYYKISAGTSVVYFVPFLS